MLSPLSSGEQNEMLPNTSKYHEAQGHGNFNERDSKRLSKVCFDGDVMGRVGIIEFFTIGLSDAFLSDYLTVQVTQNKINFLKNCPQWGLNSQPPHLQSRALPLC